MKKIFILSLISCLSAMSAWAIPSVVKIHQKEGGTVSYSLAEKPVVTMQGNNVVMTTTRTAIEYPMADVDRLTFEQGVAVSPADCDNVVYLADATVAPGSSSWLSVQLNNTEDAYGFEFHIVLPEGVSPASARGVAEVELSDRASADNHTVEGRVQGNELIVLCYSMTHTPFSGRSGEVARVKVNVDAAMAPGTYPLIATQAAVSLANSTPVVDAVQTTLTVGSSVRLGDANADGRVNVGDITTIVAYMLGLDPDPFVMSAADTNSDGVVNVTDIIAVISEIFSFSPASVNRARQNNATAEYSLGQLERDVTGALVLPVLASNSSDAFFSFQFDLVLPQGLHATGVRLANGRVSDDTSLQYNTLNDGSLRVVAYNLTATSVSGNEGAIAYISVAKDTEQEVDGDVELSQGVFANLGRTIYANDVRASIHVGSEAAISEVRSENTNVQVYNAQGQLVVSARGTDSLQADQLMQHLPQGSYIVKNGATTFKVTKK